MNPLHRVTDLLALRARGPDLELLRSLADVGPASRVLDVGGGAGAVTERLAHGAARVWVLEPNAGKVRRGRAEHPGLAFLQASAEQIPLPEASCDVAFAVMSLHHVPDQPAALREVRRVLAPGGRLLALEADPESDRGRRLARVETLLGTGATFRFPGDWCSLARDAGFREARTQPARRGFVVHARR